VVKGGNPLENASRRGGEIIPVASKQKQASQASPRVQKKSGREMWRGRTEAGCQGSTRGRRKNKRDGEGKFLLNLKNLPQSPV